MASPVLPLPIPRAEATALIRQVQSTQLFNRQLSSVCQVNGLKSTGVKAELQRRIIGLITETVNAHDSARFMQIRQSITNAFAQRPTPIKGSAVRTAVSSPASAPALSPPMPSYTNGNSSTNGHASNGSSRDYHAASNGHRPYDAGLSRLMFKPSPFYRVESSITDTKICEAMAQHRNSVSFIIKLNDHPSLQQCVTDKAYRIMVFCAGESSGVQDITFPHQSELRVNGGDIKANLRGLKNKPGSTRPVDITSALRLKPNYANTVEFTYALTNKAGGLHKFYLVANLCKITSVPQLVQSIATRRRIPKDAVIKELNKKAQDPDVVATSQVLSLKCPLSYMRLAVPCRSISCTHIQCFDATSYLQLQEQGPQWLCPICSKSAPFEQLAVDEYVRDILEKTSKSLETVTIEPNGRWSSKVSEEEWPAAHNDASFDDDDEDDDDDDLEISEVNVLGRRLETPQRPPTNSSTPASGGRNGSAPGPRGLGSVSGKRPAPQVIDLTLSSDDDDDEPIQRPAKRQSNATNGYRGPSNTGFLSESPLGNS